MHLTHVLFRASMLLSTISMLLLLLKLPSNIVYTFLHPEHALKLFIHSSLYMFIYK